MLSHKEAILTGIRAFLLPAVLLVFLVLPGCDSREKPIEVDLTKREDTGSDENPNAITYAYLPQYFHRVSFERHNPIIQHLKKETGLPIRQVYPDSFDDFIRMFSQGKIDIAFSNPFVYVKLAQSRGARAFARIIELDGKENFRGQVICRNDNKQIRTLEDCRGKRWVAVDPYSAGGYLYALGLFWDHGIRREHFAEISFVPGPGGQQEKVVFAVLSGRYDIGSVREGVLDLVADKVDLTEIRVIAYTPWYPGWLYSVRRGLDPKMVQAVQQALVKLDHTNPEYRSICDAAHFLKVIPAVDGDFEPIRSLAAKVGIDLEK